MKPTIIAVKAANFPNPQPVSRYLGVIWLIICLGGSLASAGDQPADQSWVARWGDKQLRAGEFQAYVERSCRRDPGIRLTAEGKRRLLDKCVERHLLLEEAGRLKLEQDPEVLKDLAEAREQVLLTHLFDCKAKEFETKAQITEEEINRSYADSRPGIHFRYLSVPDAEQGKKLLADWREHEAPAGLIDSGLVKCATLSEAWKGKLQNLPLREPKLMEIGADFMIVEVLAREDLALPPLQQVREDILKDLRDKKKGELMAAWVRLLSDQYQVKINQAYKLP